MVGEVLDAISLALIGAITLVAVAFWVILLGGVVLNRPVFRDLLGDDTDR